MRCGKTGRNLDIRGNDLSRIEGMSGLVEILRIDNKKGENPQSRCGRQWQAEAREIGQMAEVLESISGELGNIGRQEQLEVGRQS